MSLYLVIGLNSLELFSLTVLGMLDIVLASITDLLLLDLGF